MKINYPLRLAFLSLTILLFAVLIVFRVIIIMNDKDNDWQETKQEVTKAHRGNIYTYDHQLLSVNSIRYDVRFDGKYADLKDEEIVDLSKELSKVFNQSHRYFEKKNKKSYRSRHTKYVY